MTIIENFGIITSISWNSKKWASHPTPKDLASSKYQYVQKHNTMHESLNFAHNELPTEKDGSFIAYSPIFNRPPSKRESTQVEIIFFISTDYRKDRNPRKIVGCYAYPQIGYFEREADHPLYNKYGWGNVKSQACDIILFDEPFHMHDITIVRDNLLPVGKKLSQQGFNYLRSDNVVHILDQVSRLNASNKSLSFLVTKFKQMLSVEELF